MRRSAEQTREELVAEGLRQLQDRGVLVGLDHITLEAACAATGVPRSSSHAAWAIDDSYTPQGLFQRTVLHEWLANREDTMFADAAQTALLKAYEARGDALTRSEIIRATAQAAFDEGYGPAEGEDLSVEERGGDYLSTDLAIRFAIASQPSLTRDAEILDWLRAGETKNRNDRIEDSYKPLADLLGVRPKPGYGEQAFLYFGIAIAALIEGIGLRRAILPELGLDDPIEEPVGDEIPATLIGVCAEALVDAFFEPVAPNLT